jgi:hypothetical protein
VSLEQIGIWVGFAATLMIFSYLLGDNLLYRIALYVFVGLVAGFVTVVTFQSAILPWINSTILAENAGIGERIVGLVPILLAVLLLIKTSPRFGRLGNLALAFIVGVGTAVAVVGAVSGTLLPLTNASTTLVVNDVANGVIVLLGVVSTLVYFTYVARRVPGQVATTGQRGPFVGAVSTIGKGFIVATLGALYGGAILTGLTIFSERVAFIVARLGGG